MPVVIEREDGLVHLIQTEPIEPGLPTWITMSEESYHWYCDLLGIDSDER